MSAPPPADPLPPDAGTPPPSTAAQVFDVCHAGVVLRAVLLVHGALAVALLFVAPSWLGWLTQLSLAAAAALPGTLLWLVLGCLAKQRLARLRLVAQSALAALAGALCAGYGWAQLAWLGLAPPLALGWSAPLLAGALLAGLMFQWLVQRARLQMPAATAARLAELQSRIRPHFLFNALNSAVALVRSDPERAETVLEDLAELFRAALQTHDASATLGDELALAERYLAIEEVRFGERLRIDWKLDPAANAARLPSLILQPLVENAVRHGVEPSQTGGRLRIETRLAGSQVQIRITNTVPEVGLPVRPGAGIALRNVRERLYLLHDVALHFDAGLTPDGLWRVRIGCPLGENA
jgi:two-component system sensor histidine kinase AlgZ